MRSVLTTTSETTMKLDYIIKRIRYYFSPEKRSFDAYIEAIKNLEPLTATDWERYKDLAKHRLEVLSK